MTDKFCETKAQIRNLYTKKIVPGISMAIIDGNKTDIEYIGNTSWKSKTKLNENNLYDLASLTKVIATTSLVLKMLEEKKIASIDDAISDYLSEFTDKRITFRHLLTHTSGIKGYIPNRDQLNANELRSALLKLPVTDDFERIIKYTDTGLIYLGFIFEKIYKKPAQQVLQEEIINNFNLNETTFHPDKTLSVPTEEFNGIPLQGIVHDPKAQTLAEHCASAGLFSTLSDMVKFSKFMLDIKTPTTAPFNKDSLNSLYSRWTDVEPGRSLGWDLRYDLIDNHPILFHTGFTGTFIMLDKQNKTAMIVLTNRVNPNKNNQLFLLRRNTIVQTFLEENKKEG